MATPRIVDPDKLRELLKEDPHRNNQQLADLLTEHNRVTAGPGHGVPVQRTAVAQAICRWRPVWESDPDFPLLAGRGHRRRLVALLVERAGRPVADEYQNSDIMLMLRVLDRMREGEPVRVKDERRAVRFDANLRKDRMVVDISQDSGEPVVRHAKPDELDSLGGLVDIIRG